MSSDSNDVNDLRLGSGFDDAPSGIGNLAMYPTESYVDSRSSELVRDPLYADHLALGNGSGFYRSFDGGASFELTHDFGSGTVLEIEQGRTDRNRFFVVVRDGGVAPCIVPRTGAVRGRKLTGLPTGWSSMEIALNPADDDEVWAIRADDDDIRRSMDGGTIWTNPGRGLTDGLQGEALRDVVCLGDAGTVVVSTTGALHRLRMPRGGAPSGRSLPARWAPFECLPFHRDAVLRVGDKGKGIWQADFPFTPSPIAQPMTANPEVYCAGDSVRFACHSILVHEGATAGNGPLILSPLSSRRPRTGIRSSSSRRAEPMM